MQKKSKKPLLIMTAVSVMILIFGFLASVAVYTQLTSQITLDSNAVTVDGTDFSGILSVIGSAGAFVIGALFAAVSIIVILIQWLIFGIVILIKSLGQKASEKKINQTSI